MNSMMNKTGSEVIVNGRAYTIVKASSSSIDLRGPRGGMVNMTKNINTGDWFLIIPSGGYRFRDEIVETFEVAA